MVWLLILAKFGKAAFSPMQGLAVQFWVVATQNPALIERGEKDAAFAYLVDKTVPARNALLAPLAAEKKREGQKLRDGLGAISKQAGNARLIVVVAVLRVGPCLTDFVVCVVRLIHSLRGEPDEHKREPGRPGRVADGPGHAAERRAGRRKCRCGRQPAPAFAATGAGGGGVPPGMTLRRSAARARRFAERLQSFTFGLPALGEDRHRLRHVRSEEHTSELQSPC